MKGTAFWRLEPQVVTLRLMAMTGKWHSSWVGALMVLSMLGACTAENAETTPNTSQSPAMGQRDGETQGKPDTGQVPGSDVAGLQDGALSAAEHVASQDGLWVKNRTGAPVNVVLPNGDTALVEAGKVVVIVRPCPGRSPLRAETETGEFIAEHDGPCRVRDTWTVTAASETEPEQVMVLAKVRTLGPEGVGPLRLGMSREEVNSTGLASASLGSRHDGWAQGCAILQYRPREQRSPHLGDLDGTVSPAQGLESIVATRRMVTPDGIGLDSTLEEVRQAYPEEDARRGDVLSVPASSDAVYRIQIGGGGGVTLLALELNRQDCVR